MRYEGDNFDEEEMVDWLTDPNVMEVTDRIERVNRKMLEKLMARNEYLGVVFCECCLYWTSCVVCKSFSGVHSSARYVATCEIPGNILRNWK